MEGIINLLKRLQEKYKRNSKLSNEDYQNVKELLIKLGTSEVEREILTKYLIAFPSELSSHAILKILNATNESHQIKLIQSIITSNEFNKYQGFLRQLDIAKHLLVTFKRLSTDLILNISVKATEGGSKKASQGLTKKFAEDFLRESNIFSLILDGSISDDNYSSLSIFVINGLLNGEIDSSRVKEALIWLAKLNKKVVISKQMKRQIENDTKLWNLNLKNELYKLGMIDVHQDVLPIELNCLKEVKRLESDELVKGEKISYEAIFDRVRQYVNEIEALTNRTFQEKVSLQASLLKSENSRTYLEKKLVELEKTLSDAMEYKNNLERANQEKTDKIKYLEELLIEKEKEYEKNKNNLIDMSEVESKYLADEFKNKLKKKLRIEYKDYLEVENEDMTILLGENMRMQIRNIFSILEKEGISFGGGFN